MLERDQIAVAATLLHGPGHLPANLFAGGDAAVLRGLRVHANTISHARLVALEDTFPRTRDYLGEAAFNRASRAFVEAGGAQGRGLAHIGEHFADALADPVAADLARVEWAWLDSYHAADAPALALSDLAGLEEGELLALPVRLHAAARVVLLASDVAPLIDASFARDRPTLLVTRPDAEVRISALHAADADALGLVWEIAPLGNLLGALAEMHPDGAAAIAALLNAGALEKV